MEDLVTVLRELSGTVRAIRLACVQQTDTLSAKIRDLEERVTDLEGHAEHGPAETCGICAPDDDDEPETVGADVYGSISTADGEETCANPHCCDTINPGESVIQVDEGKYVHDYC